MRVEASIARQLQSFEAETTQPLADVAVETGFGTQSRFSR
jgi:transcriptional regulator GlxA family with amidase domain